MCWPSADSWASLAERRAKMSSGWIGQPGAVTPGQLAGVDAARYPAAGQRQIGGNYHDLRRAQGGLVKRGLEIMHRYGGDCQLAVVGLLEARGDDSRLIAECHDPR